MRHARPARHERVIRFATFEVDLQAQELRKAGLRLKLSGQPFRAGDPLEQPGLLSLGKSYKNGCGRTPSSTSIII
jgi:hypothetical protein